MHTYYTERKREYLLLTLYVRIMSQRHTHIYFQFGSIEWCAITLYSAPYYYYIVATIYTHHNIIPSITFKYVGNIHTACA